MPRSSSVDRQEKRDRALKRHVGWVRPGARVALDERIAREVLRLERGGETARRFSFVVTPNTRYWRNRGNMAAYRELGLHVLNKRQFPHSTTDAIQEAHDRAESRVYLKDGLYGLTTTPTFTHPSFYLEGESQVATILEQRTPNADGIAITGYYNTVRDLTIRSAQAATQGPSAGLRTTGPYPRIIDVQVGDVTDAQQFFWDGMSINSQYAFLRGIFCANQVHANLRIGESSLQNDQRVADVVLINWGADIYAQNPAGLEIDQTSAAQIVNLTASWNDPGVLIAPASGQNVTESLFANLNLDSNWGRGLDIVNTGGVCRLLHFTNLWANSNHQRLTAAAGAVRFSNVQGLTVEGGEVAGNSYGGVEIVGNTDGVDLGGFQIRDNNKSASTAPSGYYPGFGAIPWAGLHVNATGSLTMIGGSLDNPGFGSFVGGQNSLITSRARVDRGVALFGVSFRNNLRGVSGWGSSAPPGTCLLSDCPGFALQGFGYVTPPLPTGTGPSGAVTVPDPLRVQVLQAGMVGTRAVSLAGATVAYPSDPTTFVLSPGQRVWYDGSVPTSWLWEGL